MKKILLFLSLIIILSLFLGFIFTSKENKIRESFMVKYNKLDKDEILFDVVSVDNGYVSISIKNNSDLNITIILSDIELLKEKDGVWKNTNFTKSEVYLTEMLPKKTNTIIEKSLDLFEQDVRYKISIPYKKDTEKTIIKQLVIEEENGIVVFNE